MTTSIENELRDICKVIDDTVRPERIYLFGSYAYGTPNKESDFDLCVVMPDDAGRMVEVIVDINTALTAIQKRPVDIIACRKSQFDARKQWATLERKIAREGVLLYEQPEPVQRMA